MIPTPALPLPAYSARGARAARSARTVRHLLEDLAGSQLEVEERGRAVYAFGSESACHRLVDAFPGVPCGVVVCPFTLSYYFWMEWRVS